MIKYPKKSKNVLYGRTYYGILIEEEFQKNKKIIFKSKNKKFTLKIIKERFKSFCNEIKKDFIERYKSPRYTYILEKNINEKLNELNSIFE